MPWRKLPPADPDHTTSFQNEGPANVGQLSSDETPAEELGMGEWRKIFSLFLPCKN